MTKLPPFAPDPIPTKAIRLSIAFQLVVDALSKKQTLARIFKEEEENIDFSPVENTSDRYKAEVAADVFFRAHLGGLHGEILCTYIRDPQTGEILRLDPSGWEPQGRVIAPFKSVPSRYFEINIGMPGDYVVDPYEDTFAGPEGTIFHGACRPVFLWRDEFERWFQKTFGANASKRKGRPPGSGSWEVADEPILDFMSKLIRRGKAKSAHDAARLVADKAAGAGSPASKITRLAKRYNKRFRIIGEK